MWVAIHCQPLLCLGLGIRPLLAVGPADGAISRAISLTHLQSFYIYVFVCNAGH